MNFDSIGLNQKQNKNDQVDEREELIDEDTVVDLVNVREAEEVKAPEVSEVTEEKASEFEEKNIAVDEEEVDDYLLKPNVLIEQNELETQMEKEAGGGSSEEDLIRANKKAEEDAFQSQIDKAVVGETEEPNEELVAPTAFSAPNDDTQGTQATADNNISMVKEEKIKMIEEEIKKMEEVKGDESPDKNKSGNLAKTLLILGPIFLIACLTISFFIISQKLPNQLEILEISK